MTPDEIAALALDVVSEVMVTPVHAASMSEETQGAYDTATGAYAVTTITEAGRAVVDTVKPVRDIFAEYVMGPSDELVLLEGFTAARENMVLIFAGYARKVIMVQDILNTGSLFYVVARKDEAAFNLPATGTAFAGNEW